MVAFFSFDEIGISQCVLQVIRQYFVIFKIDTNKLHNPAGTPQWGLGFFLPKTQSNNSTGQYKLSILCGVLDHSIRNRDLLYPFSVIIRTGLNKIIVYAVWCTKPLTIVRCGFRRTRPVSLVWQNVFAVFFAFS